MSNSNGLKFEDALTACLKAVESGETNLDSILSPYPEYAEALNPIISVALGMTTGANVTADAGFKTDLRKQMVETASMGAATKGKAGIAAWPSTLRDKLAALPGGLLRAPASKWRIAAPIASAVAALILLIGIGFAASGGSLPGSPLYPLKRAGETVVVNLTTDPVTRASVHLAQAEDRLGELEALIMSGELSTEEAAALLIAAADSNEEAIALLREKGVDVDAETAASFLRQSELFLPYLDQLPEAEAELLADIIGVDLSSDDDGSENDRRGSSDDNGGDDDSRDDSDDESDDSDDRSGSGGGDDDNEADEPRDSNSGSGSGSDHSDEPDEIDEPDEENEPEKDSLEAPERNNDEDEGPESEFESAPPAEDDDESDDD